MVSWGLNDERVVTVQSDASLNVSLFPLHVILFDCRKLNVLYHMNCRSGIPNQEKSYFLFIATRSQFTLLTQTRLIPEFSYQQDMMERLSYGT